MRTLLSLFVSLTYTTNCTQPPFSSGCGIVVAERLYVPSLSPTHLRIYASNNSRLSQKKENADTSYNANAYHTEARKGRRITLTDASDK